MPQRRNIAIGALLIGAFCLWSAIAFAIGLYAGNMQAFGSRFRREGPKVESVLQKNDLDRTFEVIQGSYGEPIIVGQVTSDDEYQRLIRSFDNSWPNAMFDGAELLENR